MQTREAQLEVRTIYLGGFLGQLVSGLVWLAAAAAGTWLSARQAMTVLFVGGMFIFPLVQVLLKLMGRRASLSAENPLRFLAMQIAFTVPLVMPVGFAAATHRQEWFFPAMMIIVGAHYLPFTFLYGMRMFAVLAAIMTGGGMFLGLTSTSFTLGAWLTGIVLLIFSAIGLALTSSDARVSLPRSA